MCCLGSHCTLACNATETIPPVRVRRWVRLNPVAPRHTCSYKFHRHDRPAGSDSLVLCWKLLSTAFVVFAAVYTELWLNLCRFRNAGLLAVGLANTFLLRALALTALLAVSVSCFMAVDYVSVFQPRPARYHEERKPCATIMAVVVVVYPPLPPPRPRIPAALKGYRRMKTDWKK